MHSNQYMMTIDPGSDGTGYAIFMDGEYIDSGSLYSNKLDWENRVNEISRKLRGILAGWKPGWNTIGIEQPFYAAGLQHCADSGALGSGRATERQQD